MDSREGQTCLTPNPISHPRTILKTFSHRRTWSGYMDCGSKNGRRERTAEHWIRIAGISEDDASICGNVAQARGKTKKCQERLWEQTMQSDVERWWGLYAW
ncbi:hypothetical protein PBY51_019628 [Eleginops maclovinus]|uniref:Uncharacterized protein n=1 Tax=Eleginops maclovinus TaxID=56733 RepID=A0AAN8AME8_ELEMC|nr:hypothetical protein PBY51_019628 [Eleginops maclovinus]